MTSRPTAPRADRTVRAGRLRATASWVVFGLLVALVAALWPVQLGGGTSLTIVSGHSMDGTYASGDLVVGRTGPVEVGDVIVYEPEGIHGHIVHRVVGGDAESGWVTRGDNNSWDDPFRPKGDDVLGVVHVRVPHAWWLARFALSPVAWAFYALIVAGVLLWPGRSERDEAATDDALDPAGAAGPDGLEPGAPHEELVGAATGAAVESFATRR